MKRDTLIKECIAEFIGIGILLFFGAGSVCSLVFLKNYTSFWELSLMWGLALTLAIFVAGGVSGAHLNPAVSITLAILKKFSWKKVIPYTVAQISGAFFGAALAYGLFRQNFIMWEMETGIIRGSIESQATAGIFTTYPAPYLTNFKAMMIEIVLTAFLMLVIMAVSDEKNTAAPKGGLGAVTVGVTVAVIGGTFGELTGFALNPARDLGPKLFIMLAGWGDIGFPAPGMYFFVPIVGPILGAIIGGLVYERFIHKPLSQSEELHENAQ